ncbi:MAG: F420-dependent methylenetetrahydromethanopterin dehydrogenase [Nitrososphaerota archaeon]|nr:F420-dependent methylenetetrahydromethanopterin dehydrogenase [Candidatus Bathyarchaeota archaeon]MDW8061763.1 F420-dependent methylenetetrahydromethanopterin dehydrogenase [Nitrososphaerota archaeon]
MSGVIRIGFGKLGCIASSPLIEYLLDERADRDDLSVRIVSSGAKMGEDDAEEVAKALIQFKPVLAIAVSPNAGLPGPRRMRSLLRDAGIPTIVVSDAPSRRIIKELEEGGYGYIIVLGDSMIGARREFLDPVEMAIYNADLIKVLAVTGAFRVIQMELDKVIDCLKRGEELKLPRIIVDRKVAVEAGQFANPYARAKAIAAYEAAVKVADLTVEGCFKIEEWTEYTSIVAAAHELMSYAARQASEAREIEKGMDTVYRSPHNRRGEVLYKRKLIEKPSKPS